MFGTEITADELEGELSSAFEEMPKRELRQLLGDQGMVGEAAQQEARNRGWVFDVKVERTDQMTSVSTSVESYGHDDDDDEDEDDL